MRMGAATRDLCRIDGRRFVAKGSRGLCRMDGKRVVAKSYGDHAKWLTHLLTAPYSKGHHTSEASYGLWWLGKSDERNYMRNQSYILRYLDDPGPL